jgi:chromosomal replication initiator protein
MLTSLWDRVRAAIGTVTPDRSLDTHLGSCHLVAIDGDRLRIRTPSKQIRDWLLQHHIASIEHGARQVLGGHPQVALEADRDASISPPTLSRAPRDLSALPSTGLASRYTFESFVVGNSNQFAQAACQAVAELPSSAYNPLFIYGGVGLGKTHLLHAIGHHFARLYPSRRLVYLSTERFTNELINAIRYDRIAEFRTRYRSIDLLLIDDIHFISGKERTQEEFFHTFNDLYEGHRQIVLSSDSPPKDIPDIEERLRSRFEWGLIADVQPPDFETRVAILKKKADLERVRLPDDAAYLIARRIKANIREIEGSLTRMIAFCSMTGREMTVSTAEEVLGDLWSEDEKVLTIEHIQRTTAAFFSITLSDLRAKNRTKAIAFPRQIAMYLSRHLTHASLAEVGRAFGGKDHTTVLHAVEKIRALLHQDPKFKKTLEALTQAINA